MKDVKLDKAKTDKIRKEITSLITALLKELIPQYAERHYDNPRNIDAFIFEHKEWFEDSSNCILYTILQANEPEPMKTIPHPVDCFGEPYSVKYQNQVEFTLKDDKTSKPAIGELQYSFKEGRWEIFCTDPASPEYCTHLFADEVRASNALSKKIWDLTEKLYYNVDGVDKEATSDYYNFVSKVSDIVEQTIDDILKAM